MMLRKQQYQMASLGTPRRKTGEAGRDKGKGKKEGGEGERKGGSPERPREAQRSPERPRKAQRGPEKAREAHRAPETPREAGTSPEASKGALVARGPKMQFKQSILICFYIKKIRPPKSDSGGRPDPVPGQAQRGRCRWATCTVRWVGATLV